MGWVPADEGDQLHGALAIHVAGVGPKSELDAVDVVGEKALVHPAADTL